MEIFYISIFLENIKIVSSFRRKKEEKLQFFSMVLILIFIDKGRRL